MFKAEAALANQTRKNGVRELLVVDTVQKSLDGGSFGLACQSYL